MALMSILLEWQPPGDPFKENNSFQVLYIFYTLFTSFFFSFETERDENRNVLYER